jgi:hypothetical protein
MVSRGDGKAEAEVAHRGLGVGDVSEAVMLASGLWARKQSAFQIGSLGLSMTVLHPWIHLSPVNGRAEVDDRQIRLGCDAGRSTLERKPTTLRITVSANSRSFASGGRTSKTKYFSPRREITPHGSLV